MEQGPLVRKGPWDNRVPQALMGSLALWVQLALLDKRDHVETLVQLDQLETKEAPDQLEVQVSLGHQGPQAKQETEVVQAAQGHQETAALLDPRDSQATEEPQAQLARLVLLDQLDHPDPPVHLVLQEGQEVLVCRVILVLPDQLVLRVTEEHQDRQVMRVPPGLTEPKVQLDLRVQRDRLVHKGLQEQRVLQDRLDQLDRKVIQGNRETLDDKVPMDLKDRLEIVVRLDLQGNRDHPVHLD